MLRSTDVLFRHPLRQQDHLTFSEGFELVTLIALILVTGWYAYSTYGIQTATADHVAATREQAENSRRATEIALNATKGAVLPIVMLSPGARSCIETAPGRMHTQTAKFHYKNIGKGTALNLRVWLKYSSEEFGDDAGSTTCQIYALGSGEEGQYEWKSTQESLPLPEQSFGFDVIAEYADIYRRKFRSTLFLISAYERDFSFIEVMELGAT